MALCIIDFIAANGLLGPVGEEGALDTPGPKWHSLRSLPFKGPGVSRAGGPLPPTGPSNPFAPMKSIIHGPIRIIGQ